MILYILKDTANCVRARNTISKYICTAILICVVSNKKSFNSKDHFNLSQLTYQANIYNGYLHKIELLYQKLFSQAAKDPRLKPVLKNCINVTYIRN